MMNKKDLKRDNVATISLDDLVPKNHLVRKLDKALDFSFIYDEVEHLYSKIGAPSVDPVVLIKIVMLQHTFGITSMRQTIKEIEVNVAYRWFIGYSLDEKIPHFSTFGKNYERKFKHSNVFESIFTNILGQAMDKGLINPTEVFVDSTHIKANANKKKFEKDEIEVTSKRYQDLLDIEINKDRVIHGKKH